MHWDVVEVKPEPNYKLFVRFKDGLAGHVQLVPEELTGALAPLVNAKFFERAFVDSGAVAWPGDIDLAPDAMYGKVAASRLPRLQELRDLITDPDHPDAYFQNFENRLTDQTCFQTFALWEKELEGLDPLAWDAIKSKASSYLKRGSRGWEQLFDTLGEASAYNYLREAESCSSVSLIPVSHDRTPDLKGVRATETVLCEVKTINISDDEIDLRHGPQKIRGVSDKLGGGFFGKLDCHMNKAKTQLQSYDPIGTARHLIYLNICFDDWSGAYWDDYLRQIEKHLVDVAPGIEVVVSAGFSRDQKRLIAQH